jgi:hypothetical protein
MAISATSEIAAHTDTAAASTPAVAIGRSRSGSLASPAISAIVSIPV